MSQWSTGNKNITLKGTEEQDCLLQFHPIKDDKLGSGDFFILICFIYPIFENNNKPVIMKF